MKKFVHSLIFTVSTPTPTSNPHLQPPPPTKLTTQQGFHAFIHKGIP
jgi:hypothetical protein